MNPVQQTYKKKLILNDEMKHWLDRTNKFAMPISDHLRYFQLEFRLSERAAVSLYNTWLG